MVDKLNCSVVDCPFKSDAQILKILGTIETSTM